MAQSSFNVLEEIAEIELPRDGNFVDVKIVEITSRNGGRIVIDVRQSFINDDEEKQSTKTGWALNPDLAEELYEALGEALEKVDEYIDEAEEEKPKPRRARSENGASKRSTSTTKKAAPKRRVVRR